ncbi:hypothetical protein DYB37_006286 [Aphanomyces astaci]|uniref:Uncharacterized protein n=1 Tax=Aphanomyces astaci TaxID=112090 RepID=A0A3R6XCI7_APHAT|nr:hypothetical protein DYB35_005669 [Aphanomyces astaci]RHZ26460.1 hypothetical protein DYB37_006286 [Aphanomyces astaci]
MRFDVTPVTAVCSCLVMAAVYVGILYCCPKGIRSLPRDHPHHILARFALIVVACAGFPFFLQLFASEQEDGDVTLANKLGFHANVLETVTCTLLAVLLTMLLFAGSIVSNSLEVYAIKQHNCGATWLDAFRETQVYHNFTHDRLPTLRTLIFVPTMSSNAAHAAILRVR